VRTWIALGIGLGLSLACAAGPAATPAERFDEPAHEGVGEPAVDGVSQGAGRRVPSGPRRVDAADASSPGTGEPSSPAVNAGRAPDHTVAIDRQALDAALTSADGVGDLIGLRPRLTLRGLDGVEVTGVPADSPLAPLGLRAGDVIRKVNGRTIDSLDAAVGAGRSLDGASRVNAEILRDGSIVRLRVDIR
jgi:membrane-associated protease RseP (regulator of RpoE activity)